MTLVFVIIGEMPTCIGLYVSLDSFEIGQVNRSHGVTIDDYFIDLIEEVEESSVTLDDALLIFEQSVDSSGYGTHNFRHIEEGSFILPSQYSWGIVSNDELVILQ